MSAAILLSGCATPWPNGFLLDRLSARQNISPPCVNVFVNSTVCAESAVDNCNGTARSDDFATKARQTLREQISERKLNFEMPDKKHLARDVIEKHRK